MRRDVDTKLRRKATRKTRVRAYVSHASMPFHASLFFFSSAGQNAFAAAAAWPRGRAALVGRCQVWRTVAASRLPPSSTFKMPSRFSKNRKARGHVSAGHGRVGE